MKQLLVEIHRKDGDTMMCFKGYVLHLYWNVSARVVRVFHSGLEEDTFEDVTFLSIDDGVIKITPIDSDPPEINYNYHAA